jgi:hypothetical protein
MTSDRVNKMTYMIEHVGTSLQSNIMSISNHLPVYGRIHSLRNYVVIESVAIDSPILCTITITNNNNNNNNNK